MTVMRETGLIGCGRWIGVFVLGLAVWGPVLGQGWSAQNSGSTELLNDVWFTSASRGFAVGNAGALLETADGGATWSPRALTVDDLLDVSFRDAAVGLIVGDNGTILRTTDGGASWSPSPSGTTNNLAGVAFGADGLAFAAGRDGTILRSTDDGSTWTVVETGIERYRAVAAAGRSAWAVGNAGVIRATRDGGANWSFLSSGTSEDLHAVWFVSENEGWAAGQNSTLIHTGDAGATWLPRGVAIDVGLNAVFFGNATVGWTGGALGSAYRSETGAMNWTAEPTPTGVELNGMHFADAFNGWAVGDNGTILTRRVPSAVLSMTPTLLDWGAGSPAAAYDVLQGDLETLRRTDGAWALATDRCLADDLPATSLEFQAAPLEGQGYWFLVRIDEPTADPGTYDSGSFEQRSSRDPGIAESSLACP